MKICIIGGSGFVGTHLIRVLNKNHHVTIIDKKQSEAFPTYVLEGDIRDKEFLNKNLKEYDLVVHLAAEHKDDVSPVSLYYDVNVNGTRNILDAMDKNDIKNIIFTSSVAIYGLNKDNPDEQYPADPFNDYGKSKWQAEKVLRKWQKQMPDKKSLTILRPTVIFGEENRGNVYNLIHQILNGKFIMVGNGKNKKSIAYVGNVVSFIDYLIDQEKGYYIYNYADKPDLRTIELINMIEKTLSVKIPSLKIPFGLGLLGGYCLDVISKVSGKKFPVSSIRIKKFCATTLFDATEAHQNGFQAPYSINEGLNRTLSYEFMEKGSS